MSARPCPRCQQQLPEATLRALAQGTTCPFCAAPLKSTPRRSTAAQPIEQRSDITPPPVAIPPLAPPMTAPSPLAPPAQEPGRARKLMLMGSGAALSLAIGLLLVLRASGGATAVASVATPVTPTAPTTEALAPTTAEVAPAEAPPPAADARKTGGVTKRRGGAAKRKASVAHNGKPQLKREARAAKADRKQRTLAVKRATPSAPVERGDPRPPYERGNALLFAGDAAGAIAAYRDAVHDAPTDPIGYRGLGLAYEQKGETASAIRALHKYLKLAPGAADRTIISRRIDRLSKNAGAK